MPTQESYRLFNEGISNTLTCRQKPITKYPDLRVQIRALSGRDSQLTSITGKASFEVILTNNSKESVKNITVTDLNAPDCNRASYNIPEIFVDETISYKCSMTNTIVHYLNPVHKISSSAITYDTNKLTTNIDTTYVNVYKLML